MNATFSSRFAGSWLGVLAATVAGLIAAPTVVAQQRIDWSKVQVTTTDLGNSVYLLNWQGGDSLVLVTDEGVVLVDTSVAENLANIKAAIAKLTDKPIRYVIVTHAHADHFGGNEVLGKSGATIVAHDNARARMVKGQYLAAFNQTIPPSPAAAIPSITFKDSMTLHVGGETIELFHVPRAHTDNDALVYFRRANVVHMSGTFGNDTTYTFFDSSSDGSLAGTIVAQEKVLAFANDRTRIIADEGGPATTAALKASHEAFVTLRARVQKLVDDGKSEAEAIAAKPTRDLDATWVHQGSFLTGDRITQMAYQSLKGIKPPTTPPRQ